MEFLKNMVSPKPYYDALAPEMKAAAAGDAQTKAALAEIRRRTYSCIRIVMLAIAVLLPIVFLISAIWVDMQGSISAFYHTDMRNVFVGALFAIGICLYVYKGYNNLENNGLTVAGLFLFCVALFPTGKADVSLPPYFPVIHHICAVTFFGLIAVVCIFARPNGLKPVKAFASRYNITAILMILVLAAAAILLLMAKVWDVQFRYSIFCLEASAVWVFALYWGIKSWELKRLG